VIEPDRVRVRAAQEALDDAELDQAAHVDREVVEGEVVDPGRERVAWSEAGVEREERREGDGGGVACFLLPLSGTSAQ